MSRYVEVKELIGMTMKSAEQIGDDEIRLTTVDGRVFKLYHSQNCCESVYIESVVGDLNDLVGEPLLVAEESEGETPSDFKFNYEPESYTWTFYKFATRKGYVDIRWLGTSNGYYGESAICEEVLQ